MLSALAAPNGPPQSLSPFYPSRLRPIPRDSLPALEQSAGRFRGPLLQLLLCVGGSKVVASGALSVLLAADSQQ